MFSFISLFCLFFRQKTCWFRLLVLWSFHINLLVQKFWGLSNKFCIVRNNHIGNDFLFFVRFHCSQLFYCHPCPTLAPPLLHPCPTAAPASLKKWINRTNYFCRKSISCKTQSYNLIHIESLNISLLRLLYDSYVSISIHSMLMRTFSKCVRKRLHKNLQKMLRIT